MVSKCLSLHLHHPNPHNAITSATYSHSNLCYTSQVPNILSTPKLSVNKRHHFLYRRPHFFTPMSSNISTATPLFDDFEPDPTLTNDDLNPTTSDQRTFSGWEMASLWIGLVVGVPTYYLAGSLVDLGMAWWQGICGQFVDKIRKSHPWLKLSSFSPFQTTSLVYVFPSALSLGVSTRVGNELGANRPAKARISMIISLICAVALGLAAMLFTTLMRHYWGRFFTTDTEILDLTAMALPIAGLCKLGNCPQTTGCGVLRGSARPTIGANINLGSFYLVGMPVAFLMGFVFKMGFAGLWFGLLAAQASCAILMLCVLCKTDWMVQVERAKELTKSSPSQKPTTSLLPIVTLNPSATTKKKNGQNLDEILCSFDDELVKSSAALEADPLISTTTELVKSSANLSFYVYNPPSSNVVCLNSRKSFFC